MLCPQQDTSILPDFLLEGHWKCYVARTPFCCGGGSSVLQPFSLVLEQWLRVRKRRPTGSHLRPDGYLFPFLVLSCPPWKNKPAAEDAVDSQRRRELKKSNRGAQQTPLVVWGPLCTVFFIENRSDFSQGESKGHCGAKAALASSKHT